LNYIDCHLLVYPRMMVETRRTRGSLWALWVVVVALAFLTTGSDPPPYSGAVAAFTPSLWRTRTEGRHAHGVGVGTAPTFWLHAFPSDQQAPQPLTAAAKAQLQNDHFASSQTTSSVSQDSSSSTTLAPPVMARPATESKGNDHKLARVEQKQQPQEEEEEEAAARVPVWDRVKPVDIQGGSQRTWSFAQHSNMVEVHVRNPYGNPMHAQIDLWQGPGNTPQKVTLYSEEGRARPFRCFFSTPPGGYSNSINIRNTATMEFPIQAVIDGSNSATNGGGMDRATKHKMERIAQVASSSQGLRQQPGGQSQQYEKMLQGGATITERFEANVQSVQVYLASEGRPINCRIELISGPNTLKQVMEVYCEEGNIRPFYTVIETPGFSQGVVRIINTSTMEFPFTSIVQPWDIISTREMHDQMLTQTQHGLGGTSSPFEVSGGYGGTGPASGFGSTVAQFGGTQPQEYDQNKYNTNNNVRSVGSPVVGMGGLAVPKPKRLKRATMLPPPSTKTKKNTAKKKTKLVLPAAVVEDVDNNSPDETMMDIECTINDDDASDIDIECAVGDIDAKIEAEVDRKMAEVEAEDRKAAKAWDKKVAAAAAKKAAQKASSAAATAATSTNNDEPTELKKLLDMKQKLEEQIKAEAEARFQERLQHEKEEIASMQEELERVRQEKKQEEANEKQEELERQHEVAAEAEATKTAAAAAVVERDAMAARQQQQDEVKAAAAANDAMVERKHQLQGEVEQARKQVEQRQQQLAQVQSEAVTNASERRKRTASAPSAPQRIVLQIDDAFK